MFFESTRVCCVQVCAVACLEVRSSKPELANNVLSKVKQESHERQKVLKYEQQHALHEAMKQIVSCRQEPRMTAPMYLETFNNPPAEGIRQKLCHSSVADRLEWTKT
jgi:hypothetical protein